MGSEMCIRDRDQAVVVIVEEVGAMVDAVAVDTVAVDAAEIKRRRMVVPPLQHLRMRCQHLPQDLQARPCRDGQFLWEETDFGGKCWSGQLATHRPGRCRVWYILRQCDVGYHAVDIFGIVEWMERQ